MDIDDQRSYWQPTLPRQRRRAKGFAQKAAAQHLHLPRVGWQASIREARTTLVARIEAVSTSPGLRRMLARIAIGLVQRA
ncbi:MAG: hypothetical protein EBS42_07425 [Caulobacteraceae bacterium]|nr:hypothetical protein [Caulobacteraceae bacterium]